MRIAVASGKGGTGKTTVAAALAMSLASRAGDTIPRQFAPLFLDCDVEAPNAHVFLHPVIEQRQEVGILIPQVDEALCTHCGKCAEVCQYHALAVLGKKTLVFSQLCHGCGSCARVCPSGAISETLDVIGVLERGRTPGCVDFARGVLNIGEPMAVPVIRQLKKWALPRHGQVVILDSPPGTSCPVVESVRGADFILLVTEPTPFGLHDLRLAAQVTRELGIPAGVVLNRCSDGLAGGAYKATLEAFCREQSLPVLLTIPFDRQYAAGIAQGYTLLDIEPEFDARFQDLVLQIFDLLGRELDYEAAGHTQR